MKEDWIGPAEEELSKGKEVTGVGAGICSSIRMVRVGNHDKITVWNHGANAGELVVQAGDGPEFAARILNIGKVVT